MPFQVCCAAIIALVTGSFALCLVMLAVLQAVSAIGAPRPASSGLNEWDGAAWLIALALFVHAF